MQGSMIGQSLVLALSRHIVVPHATREHPRRQQLVPPAATGQCVPLVNGFCYQKGPPAVGLQAEPDAVPAEGSAVLWL